MCTVYTGRGQASKQAGRQAGRQAVSCERGAASLVHEGDAATLGHVTEGVSRETGTDLHLPACLPEAVDETDVSRDD